MEFKLVKIKFFFADSLILCLICFCMIYILSHLTLLDPQYLHSIVRFFCFNTFE